MLVSVLGPVAVLAEDGAAVPIRGLQMRRVLAALAVHAPEPVPVDRLDDLLWPDGPPSTNALHAIVSKLRRAVAPVARTAGGYALAIAPDELDVHRFERLVVSGRDAAAGGDHDRAADQLAEALALWRGRPYDEIADHTFGQAPAARLTSLRDAALAARLETDLARGKVDEVAAEAEALVRAEPLVERWWALLMIARYRQDRQSEALRAFADARRVLAEELGLEPGPELRDLEARILGHDPSLDGLTTHPAAPTARRPTFSGLPERLVSFVGRERELAALTALAAPTRLLTLVGPGGAGKTTVAVELARRLVAADPSRPAALVELAPLPPGSAVVAEVSRALGVVEGDRTGNAAADELDRLVDALGDRRALLVLDNCEHVIDDAATLTSTLLSRCPGLHILATSREPMAVPGEVSWAIPPMARQEALDLLAARALAVRSDFVIAPEDQALAEQLVERLDGLPLAIELAAARLRSLSLADIASRLDDRFSLLTSTSRGIEPRQQTLRRLVDWSHDLLEPAEQVVFRRLAAFSGGATLAAAEAVCADPDGVIAPAEVADLVGRLVDKSLVIADHRPAGVRYRMLQTLLDYAAARLVDAGEAEATRQRHAEHFAAFVAPVERGLLGAEQGEWLDRLRMERANITAAIEHALALDDADLAVRLVAPLGWCFFVAGDEVTGAELMREALACSGPADPRLRSLALGAYAWLTASGPDIRRAQLTADQALATLGTYDDPTTECFVICCSLIVKLFCGDAQESWDLLPLAEHAAERSGDRWCRAMVTLVRGELHHQVGDTVVAERLLADAGDAFAALGDRFCHLVCVTEAAEVAELRGEYDRAVRMFEEGLAGMHPGLTAGVLAIQARLANLEVLRGNLSLAESMHREVLEHWHGSVGQWPQAMSLVGLATIARRRHDPATAAAHLEAAWEMARTRAVPLMRSIALVDRGYTADQQGDARRALELQVDGLAAARKVGAVRAVANALEGLAGALAAVGRTTEAEPAARLLGLADALRRRSGGPMPAAERFDVDRAEGRARATLGEEGFTLAFVAGSEGDRDAVAGAAVEVAEDAIAAIS
jgi:predicted ATPase/DNA-binding SARP family transcriptional activator